VSHPYRRHIGWSAKPNHNGRRYDNRLLGAADGPSLDSRRQEVDFPRWIGFRRNGGNLRIDRTDACRWVAPWNSVRTERDLADDVQERRETRLCHLLFSDQHLAERSVES